jgi:TonB family protein
VAYPPQGRGERIEGEVVASFWISGTGDVIGVRAFKGDPLLAHAVEETVRNWRFKPVMSGDKAVTVNATASFEFVLGAENQRVDGVVPEIGRARQPQRIRVSEGVVSGLLVHKVKPVYPPGARQAHIKGTVLLRIVIDKEGRITDLMLVSGPKELAPAAISAVQQWRYRPYLIMGNPIEVDTEVKVNF